MVRNKEGDPVEAEALGALVEDGLEGTVEIKPEECSFKALQSLSMLLYNCSYSLSSESELDSSMVGTD